MTVKARVWRKPGCELCEKAIAILIRAGLTVETYKAIHPEDMAEFAAHDLDPLAVPLVRVNVDGKPVRWWGPDDIKGKFVELVRQSVAENWCEKKGGLNATDE